MMLTIPPKQAMPLDQQAVIGSLRGADEVRAGQAGLIDVGAALIASGIPYVHILMKIPGGHRGVHYNLALHLIGERTLQIRGHVDEGELAGIREAVVYEMARRRSMLQGGNRRRSHRRPGARPLRPLHGRLCHEYE